ncbi:MAG: hypothetical protein KDA17_07685 [Candidatus Saccharibacteria bacterium]|nr:hypothetical protein [Candidatus Saccharibacteria bacterium]
MIKQQITPTVHQDALAIARELRKELIATFPQIAPFMRVWTDKRAWGVRSKCVLPIKGNPHLNAPDQVELLKWQLE